MRKYFITIQTLGLLFLFLWASPVQSQTGDPCLGQDTFRIVILGSSTAAGAGPSSRDSSWVNRYRRHLQSINPANEVINLARGGYTTYHSMPNNFLPPLGRPSPDRRRNIDTALSLQPDAIIINYPSNDASRGYGVTEQMGNFDSIVAYAGLQNVPVWVCTTQPKTNFGATSNAIQTGVRDSIFSHYGALAIDFWTTIAAANNDIDPLYDSGDGTHLNNAGHRILNQRVMDKNILRQLLSLPNYADFFIYDILFPSDIYCGSAQQSCSVIVGNYGISNSQNIDINLVLQNGIPTSQTISIPGGIGDCALDTVQFTFDASAGGNLTFTTWASSVADSNASNDTLILQRLIHVPPTFSFTPDTVCRGDSALLSAQLLTGDQLYWYNTLPGKALNQSPPFVIPNLQKDSTLYIQARSGLMQSSDSLHGLSTANVNWNGVMFDIVARAGSISIDSLACKMESTGSQIVEIYYKSGSHFGSETTASAWTLWGIDTVDVPVAAAVVNLHPGQLKLGQGDTVGVYIQMQNSTSQISYQRASIQQSIINPKVELILGSGSSHNFSRAYYPRLWSGTLYYHFFEGSCASDVVAVTASISDTSPFLGNDTTLTLVDTFRLTLSGYSNILWSTGDTTASIAWAATDLGLGTHQISVSAENAQGCTVLDTIQIQVVPSLSIEKSKVQLLSIYPNPVTDILNIELLKNTGTLQLFSLLGQEVMQQEVTSKQAKMDILGLDTGVYMLIWRHDGELVSSKVVVR